MSAVHRFDLTVLSQENVDILIPIVPTNEEVQQYKEYLAKNNSLDGLTLEDQFLAQLMNIERLTQKLTIMSFMGGFEESYNLLIPVLLLLIKIINFSFSKFKKLRLRQKVFVKQQAFIK